MERIQSTTMHGEPAMAAAAGRPRLADVAAEIATLITGLGIVTIAIFPLALPVGALLAVPLALLGLAGLLIAGIVLAPLWLARAALRAVSRGARSGPRPRAGRGAAALGRAPSARPRS